MKMKRTFSTRHAFLIQDALANINEMLHLSIRTDETVDDIKTTMRIMRSITAMRMRLETGGAPEVEDPRVQMQIRELEKEASSILARRSSCV